MAITVLLAGGTGFIGSHLADMLRQKGYSVRILTRRPRVAGEFSWDPVAGRIDDEAVRGAEVVVNLAGAGIADKRWTPARKQLIIDSRVKSAAVLRDAFRRLGQLPQAYIASSAIGFYGNSGESLMYETDAPADRSFLAESCAAWETAGEATGALGIRTVIFRTGIVLQKNGGALRELIKPLRFGIGAYFADGQAWYSWLHLDDMCRMYLWAIEHPAVEGIFNAVAPHPARNIELVKATARAMGGPALFAPAPAFAMRLVFGEMADTVLFSNRVAADKILAAGFHFQYPELQGALDAIFRK